MIVFLLLLIVELILFFLVKKSLKKKNVKKSCRVLFVFSFIIIFILTIFFAIFPPAKQISVTGKYQFSSTDYWVTENQTDPYLNDGSLRQLQVRKWQPLECSENHPVVIASHGSGGTVDNNGTFYKELVSHGYTVLAVVHPGQASSMVYEDGRKTGLSKEFLKQSSSIDPDKDWKTTYKVFSEWMRIRKADLNTVMDDYLEKNGAVNFIMFGHSLGGSAAYAMARSRTDVIGAIALESPFMADVYENSEGEIVFDDSDYTVPLLNVYSDSSYSILKQRKDYKNNAKFLESNNPLYTNIYYEGTVHMGLCDISLISPVLTTLLSGKRQKVNAYEHIQKMNADCLNWIQMIE